jgi:hypothetical protein
MALAEPKGRKSVAVSARANGPNPSSRHNANAERRESPRVPILTQVEAKVENRTLLGRAAVINAGGLLVETSETLTEGAAVVVRFFVPPDRRPVETVGRVARVEPGKSMAIAFLGLPEDQRQTILEYVRSVEGERGSQSLDLKPAAPQRRRSGRVRRHVMLGFTWQDASGHPQQEVVETQLLSQHGCLFQTMTEFKVGQLLRAKQSDSGRAAEARVVMVKPSAVLGRLDVAVEFVGTDDFWGFEFPTAETEAQAAVARAGKRRGGRVEQRVTVLLQWEDEYGRTREESAETRNLSQHGARLALPQVFVPGQRVRLLVPEKQREAEGRVIWSRPGEAAGSADSGIEFVEVEDFWGLPELASPPASNYFA